MELDDAFLNAIKNEIHAVFSYAFPWTFEDLL